MPWNDNKGGGGWNAGGGGRGPWGQGPSNGGGGRGQGPNMRPPDLDEVFKRARDWFKRMFPNQPPGGMMFAGIGGLVLLLWLWTGVYTIAQQELGVVTRFGAYVDLLQPGIHVRFPQPIESVTRQSVQQRQINIGYVEDPSSPSATPTNVPRESLMLAGDGNIVDIDFTVFWRIQSAPDFTFNVAEPEDTIKAVAESAMREAAGQLKFDIASGEGRGDLENKVRTIMQKTLDLYRAGVSVTKVNMRRADPPKEVLDAFRDVQAAEQDKTRKTNEANQYSNVVIPKAEGDAEKMLQDAEAYKAQQIAEAKGEAQRFLSILAEYKNSKEVTRERLFLETMQRVLGSTNKVILQGEGGSPVVPYLPLTDLRRSQPPPSAAATGGGQ